MDLTQPQVMGILNVTPDSFSDGGQYLATERAVARAAEMVAQGAAIIDVGGESTRPGAEAVPLQEELDRVIPVIAAIRARLDVPVSIDTSKPEVMREAVRAGANMINDVYALRADGALEAAAQLQVPVCLMHMQGQPRTMQQSPRYDDVVQEVSDFLRARMEACKKAGIVDDNIVIDPGFGFGKALAHNLILFRHLSDICALGAPVLVGVSRKSMLGTLLDKPADQRVYGGVALVALALWMGARIVRVHDVAQTIDALKTIRAVQQAEHFE